MFDTDNLDWKKYETITKYIYETLGKESGVKIECFGNNCKVIGKSNVKHQIDVLTMHSDGIHTYKTAIECKYWNEKINKDIVMKVAEIIEDAGINKGVIVSKKGFTQDGLDFAKYKNIGIVELREIDDEDLKSHPKVFDIKSWLIRAEILDVIIDAKDKTELEKEVIEIDKMRIELADGKQIPFIEYIEAFKKGLRQEQLFNIVSKRYLISGGKLLNEKTNSSIKINAIIFTGVLTKSDLNIKYTPVDQIWLIMKLFFEDKTFTISKNGVIHEKLK